MTIKVPKNADETWFNAFLREVMRAQGLRVIHVREADTPGPSDLIVWSGSEVLGWVELKVDGKPLEKSQKEFLRERDAEAGNAYVFNLNRKDGIIRTFRGADLLWNSLSTIDDVLDPAAISWKQWFWRNRRDGQRYK